MWSSACVTSNGIGIISLACFKFLYQMALGVALDLVGVAALFMIMLAGIKYITSGGGKQVEEAKNILTYAIIGLLVVLIAVAVVNFISGITGVTCLMTFSCH